MKFKCQSCGRENGKQEDCCETKMSEMCDCSAGCHCVKDNCDCACNSDECSCNH